VVGGGKGGEAWGGVGGGTGWKSLSTAGGVGAFKAVLHRKSGKSNECVGLKAGGGGGSR